MARVLIFTWHRWEYPKGTLRRRLICGRCGYSASHDVDPTAPAPEHKAATSRHVCPAPLFFWDDWRREAFELGMLPAAAEAGRALIREAHQHAWPWEPNTAAMMALGLANGRRAARRWARILGASSA
jgi:hypothetical protein